MISQTPAIVIRAAAIASALFGTTSRIVLAWSAGRWLDIFGYFTIQSNLMVCAFLVVAIARSRRPQSERLHVVHGGVLLYILVTAIIYNVLLAGDLSEPSFSALILVVNHTVTPILFLVDWVASQQRSPYKVRAIWLWLIYPVLYGIFGSIEGALTGRFRYFFLDFASVRPGPYLVQLAAVVVFFVLLCFLILAVNRLVCRTSSGTSER